MPGGRPTKFVPEFLHICEKLYSKGWSITKIADLLGVCEKTIHNWRAMHGEFLQPFENGKTAADALVEAALFRKATGWVGKDTKFATHEGHITDEREYEKHYPGDTAAQIFWLTNRCKDHWQSKTEQEITHSGQSWIKMSYSNQGEDSDGKPRSSSDKKKARSKAKSKN